jgi:glycosyltransferase involved in cell wall biosynthesis
MNFFNVKILIATTGIPPLTGGAQQVAWETAKRLAADPNNSVHLVTPGEGKNESREGVVIHYFPERPLLTLYYSSLGRKTVKNLLAEDYDIIHVHMLLPWAYLFRKASARKVLTLHGYDTYRIRGHERYLTLKAAAAADVISAPSRWLKDCAEKTFGRPVELVLNGVDTGKFCNDGTARENYILFYGRYAPEKGIREILEAAKKLPQYEFRFAGSGPLEHEILGENVKNLGFISGKTLVEAINRAAICVFPSYRENLPLVGLEAMSCGKAIISTECGFSEILEDGIEGIIIPSKDVESLTNAVSRLMKDEGLRNRIGDAARKKAQGYDWEVIIRAYVCMYKRILGEDVIDRDRTTE